MRFQIVSNISIPIVDVPSLDFFFCFCSFFFAIYFKERIFGSCRNLLMSILPRSHFFLRLNCCVHLSSAHKKSSIWVRDGLCSSSWYTSLERQAWEVLPLNTSFSFSDHVSTLSVCYSAFKQYSWLCLFIVAIYSFGFVNPVHGTETTTIKMLMGKVLCRVTPRQLMASRLIASSMVRRDVKTPIQEWGWTYLQRQKALGRPIAPHLTVYKPQLTWMVSGFHRVTGCAMAGVLLFGGVGFALLPWNFTQFVDYIRSWNIPPVITSVFKFIIAYPIIFHTLNGIRFLGFDLAKGVENTKAIYRSGYLVLALSFIISAAVVINAWPQKHQKRH
ncbi:hypothetical protein GCK32_003119 [Trichostrongylus colubriformis]|uniref:Succinate dehydrogenase cytochrome b560 subunit, mitochondrial n=1 Tax=Trichostrongylus colubriformis TaxID=6319 RepID=A0AAN8FWT8_TRICO